MAKQRVVEVEGVARRVDAQGKGADVDVRFVVGQKGVQELEVLPAPRPNGDGCTVRVHYSDGRAETYYLGRPSSYKTQ